MRKLFLLTILIAASNFSFTGDAHAQACITKMFSGIDYAHTRMFTLMTLQRDNSYVVYETGVFDVPYNGSVAGLGQGWWSNASQGFFDRNSSVDRTISVSTNGIFGVTNRAAGTSAWLYTAVCNGDIITWSDSTRLYTLTFGPLVFRPI